MARKIDSPTTASRQAYVVGKRQRIRELLVAVTAWSFRTVCKISAPRLIARMRQSTIPFQLGRTAKLAVLPQPVERVILAERIENVMVQHGNLVQPDLRELLHRIVAAQRQAGTTPTP
jgi:hypothetical protein